MTDIDAERLRRRQADYQRKYRAANRELVNQRKREAREKFRVDNPDLYEQIKKQNRERERERRANNPHYKEQEAQRSRTRWADPEFREQFNRRQRERRANDSDYRERRNARTRERRANNPMFREYVNQRRAELRATQPDYHERERIRARKYRDNPETRERLNRNAVEWSRIRRARKSCVQTIRYTAEQWAAKVAYWGDRCWICSGTWTACDHVKPIALGGADMLCNVRPICKSCNSSKRDKWPLTDALGIHSRKGETAA